MTVIVLLLPTLQTLVMGRLSSTRPGITPTGIIRGYEQLIHTSHCFVEVRFTVEFCVCVCALKDGYQQNYKRGAGQGPRGVSRGSTQAMRSWKAFQNDCDWFNLHHTENSKFKNAFAPAHPCSLLLVPRQWYSSCLFNQSYACFDTGNIKSFSRNTSQAVNPTIDLQKPCDYNIPGNLNDFISYFLYWECTCHCWSNP